MRHTVDFSPDLPKTQVNLVKFSRDLIDVKRDFVVKPWELFDAIEVEKPWGPKAH